MNSDKHTIRHLGNESMANLHEDFAQAGIAMRFRSTMRGGSMNPLLRKGDTILIEQTPACSLRKGDLVVFRRNRDEFVAHRLIRKRSTNGRKILITRGDACLRNDPPFDDKHLIGRIPSYERANQTYSTNSPLHQVCRIVWIYLYPIPTLLTCSARKMVRYLTASGAQDHQEE